MAPDEQMDKMLAHTVSVSVIKSDQVVAEGKAAARSAVKGTALLGMFMENPKGFTIRVTLHPHDYPQVGITS